MWAASQQAESVYLSIYQSVILLKGVRQHKTRVQGDNILAPSVPCLFVGEYTEKGLSKILHPFHLLPFMKLISLLITKFSIVIMI